MIEKQINEELDDEKNHKEHGEDPEPKLSVTEKESSASKQNGKHRVQLYVDPRSTKIRKNFSVLNENIQNIRKIDPDL